MKHLRLIFLSIINIFLIFLPFIWILYSYLKGKDNKEKKLSKATFYSILFLIALVSVVTGVFDIYRIYEWMHVKSCAELAGVTATVLTIIATIFGYFYNKSQSKIQAIHAESEWRKRLLDLEKKPFYTTDDLLELNSFINPYHKIPNDKDNKDNLDIYVNNVIVECIHHLTNDDDSNNSNTIKKNNYEVENYLEKILFGDSEENKENDKPEKSTLWDIWPKNICSYCSLVLTNENDIIKIRRCIHALLKDDWEKIVRQHTFYKE